MLTLCFSLGLWVFFRMWLETVLTYLFSWIQNTTICILLVVSRGFISKIYMCRHSAWVWTKPAKLVWNGTKPWSDSFQCGDMSTTCHRSNLRKKHPKYFNYCSNHEKVSSWRKSWLSWFTWIQVFFYCAQLCNFVSNCVLENSELLIYKRES